MRGNIPLWIKPSYFKEKLIYDDRKIFALYLPTTVLASINLKTSDLPGLDIFNILMKELI